MAVLTTPNPVLHVTKYLKGRLQGLGLGDACATVTAHAKKTNAYIGFGDIMLSAGCRCSNS